MESERPQCDYRIGDELNEPMVCTLDEGHQVVHKTEGGYIFSTEQSLRYETELENQQDIDRLRGELKTRLKEAREATAHALRVVTQLKDNSVFDIEFAESEGYIEHAIRESGLFNAAALAMVEVLLK